jgi:hypothetical protein
MLDYVRPYIEKIEAFLNKRKETLELILIGGLAMSFYGEERYTMDIDGEVSCSEALFYALLDYLEKEGLNFNIGEDISHWGVIPLPEGYRDRAKTVYKSDYLTIRILDPVDFIFSKLMRGTEEDFKDILAVIKRYKIRGKDIIERGNLIKYPKDPETLFFKKKIEHLLSLIR